MAARTCITLRLQARELSGAGRTYPSHHDFGSTYKFSIHEFLALIPLMLLVIADYEIAISAAGVVISHAAQFKRVGPARVSRFNGIDKFP